jgi:hypothetical protein
MQIFELKTKVLFYKIPLLPVALDVCVLFCLWLITDVFKKT